MEILEYLFSVCQSYHCKQTANAIMSVILEPAREKMSSVDCVRLLCRRKKKTKSVYLGIGKHKGQKKRSSFLSRTHFV